MKYIGIVAPRKSTAQFVFLLLSDSGERAVSFSISREWPSSSRDHQKAAFLQGARGRSESGPMSGAAVVDVAAPK